MVQLTCKNTIHQHIRTTNAVQIELPHSPSQKGSTHLKRWQHIFRVFDLVNLVPSRFEATDFVSRVGPGYIGAGRPPTLVTTTTTTATATTDNRLFVLGPLVTRVLAAQVVESPIRCRRVMIKIVLVSDVAFGRGKRTW